MNMLDWICYKLVVFFYLKPMAMGRLDVTLPDGSVTIWGNPKEKKFIASINVHDWSLFTLLVFKESIGLAEAYMDQKWDTPNMSRFVEFALENGKAGVQIGPPKFIETMVITVTGFYRYLFPNRGNKSLENVQEHYDIGNDMYQKMLDAETLSYTCGLWRDPKQLIFDNGFGYFKQGCDYSVGLGQSQMNKIDYIIAKAGIKKGDKVLELGCGWGGFSCRAAVTTGCSVRAYNLSVEQVTLARERAEKAGVSHLVEYVQKDYRDSALDCEMGSFDKIISIGMMEHVGHYDFNNFFDLVDKMLKPSGTAVIHTITSADREYDVYRHKTGFIQKYIFPGCCIPSKTSLVDAVATTKLEVQHMENIGEHYALTLRAWRENFYQNIHEIEKYQNGKYGEKFQRMWDFYLCNCEAEFSTGHFGLVHLLLRKPSADYRGEQIDKFLPPLSSLYTAPGVKSV